MKSAIKIFRVNVIGYQQLHMIQSTCVAQILISGLADIHILIWVYLNLIIENRTGWGRLTGDSECEHLLPDRCTPRPTQMVNAALPPGSTDISHTDNHTSAWNIETFY